MNHLSELTLSMHADGELTPTEAASVTLHVDSCAVCQAVLAALRGEANVIAAALAAEPQSMAAPAFQRPMSYADFAVAGAVLVAGALLFVGAPALLGYLLPESLMRINLLEEFNVLDYVFGAAMFLVESGGSILTFIAQAAAVAVVIFVVGWIVYALRARISGPLMVSALLSVIVLQPDPAQAVDIRGERDGSVFVAADESIDDTLIAFGETIEVNGNVSGDVIAFGRRVAIRGHVAGLVYTAAQTVTIEGEVDGSVFGAGQTLTSTNRIGGNLFGFASTVSLNERSHVEQNALVFGERTNVAGRVARDLFAFADQAEVSAAVGGSLTAYAQKLTLLAPAQIAGDVIAHVRKQSDLVISPGATVGGATKTELRTVAEERSEYTTVGFFIGQLLWLAAAFLTGALLLALVPGLRRLPLYSAGNAVVAGGIGLVALVAAPIIAVIVAITVVGIPIAAFGLLLWIAGIYLAKVVLAHFIGARLMPASDGSRHFTAALALGLLLVMLVTNLPYIGGVLNFLLTICGLGLLVLFVWRTFRGTSAYEVAS